jgi:hypothetical protein
MVPSRPKRNTGRHRNHDGPFTLCCGGEISEQATADRKKIGLMTFIAASRRLTAETKNDLNYR